MTQAERVRRYILSHPECSTMDIQLGLRPFISNPRARISDLRASGVIVDCAKDDDGVARYTIRDATPGIARISNVDSKAQIERKMAEAFAPVSAAREAWERVFGGDL